MVLQKDNRKGAALLALYGVAALTAYSTLHGGGFGEFQRWTIAFLGIAFMLLTAADKNRTLAFPRKNITIPWVAFLIWMAISTIFSAVPNVSLFELLAFCGILASGLLAYSLPEGERHLSRALLIILIGTSIVTLVGWYFYLLGRFTIKGGHEMVRHFIGPFFWKNPMAGYFVLFLPVAICAALNYKGIYRWLSAVLAALIGGGLILTRSRGGWLAFGIATVVILAPSIIRKIKRREYLLIAGIIVVGVALGLSLAPPKVLSKRAESIMHVTSGKSEGRSTSERIAMLEAGLKITSEHPIFGVGPRAWPAVRAPYLTELKFLPRFPHNAYLRAAAELGIPGLVILLLALAMTFIPLWLSAYSRKTSLIATGIAAGSLGLLLHMGIDFQAAFAGILLPLTVLTAIGLRLIHLDTDKSPFGGNRGPIIAIGIMFIIILFCRGFADIQLTDYQQALDDGELETAEESCELAAALNPLSWEAQHNLFKINMIKGEPELALINARAALRLAPTLSELHRSYAIAQLAVGDTLSAMASYRRAIATAPRAAADAYLELADVLSDYGRPEESADVLLSLTDALEPFAEGNFTAPTAGYRYKVAGAWSRLAEIWRDSGDSSAAIIAEERAVRYGTPRETDLPLTTLGLESLSPEMTVVRLFDALATGDTSEIRRLSEYKTGQLPSFANNVEVSVERIIDVSEEPLLGNARVQVVLEITDSTGTKSQVTSGVSLKLIEGHWAVSFRSSNDE